MKSIYAGQLRKNLPIFAIDAWSLSAYVSSERDAAMGISKMPLWRFRQREDRIFDNKESSDEEDLERDMQNAFELLNQLEAERAQNKLNEYLNNLNDEEELEEE